MKTEIVRGWGVRVDDPQPRLAWFIGSKRDAEVDAVGRGERPVRVVLLPLAEFRRLKRATSAWLRDANEDEIGEWK